MSMLVTAQIRSLSSDGRFVGSVIQAEDSSLIGMTVFVANVLPDELIEAEVVEKHKNFLEANLTQIINVSPNRIVPPCQFFARCGGCSLQHLNVVNQHRLKQELFLQTYKKITAHEFKGQLQSFNSTLPDFNYRKRINLHWRDEKLGFFEVDSHNLVEIDQCLLANHSINQTLKVLRTVTQLFPINLKSITLDQLDDGQISVLFQLDPKSKSLIAESLNKLTNLQSKFSRLKIVQGQKTLFTNINEEKSLGHFSQVNQVGNDYLQKLVLKYLASNNVTELYAGGGNFTFPLAKAGKRVIAIEADRSLVKFANQEAAKFKLKDLTFVKSRAEDFVQKNMIRESLLLDPPRAGAKVTLRTANLSKTKEVIYVSCNPATFIRDSLILESKGFQLEFVELVDMFPNTAHIELVAKFILDSESVLSD